MRGIVIARESSRKEDFLHSVFAPLQLRYSLRKQGVLLLSLVETDGDAVTAMINLAKVKEREVAERIALSLHAQQEKMREGGTNMQLFERFFGFLSREDALALHHHFGSLSNMAFASFDDLCEW